MMIQGRNKWSELIKTCKDCEERKRKDDLERSEKRKKDEILSHIGKTYGDYLAEHIGHVKAGELAFVPWVYCALAQGTDRQKQAAAHTLAEVLAGLNADGLIAMDLRMRATTSMEWSISWRTLGLEDLFAKNLSLAECRAVLVFSTFHPNGYIREQAVAALGTDSQALPAVLLRCNDWVAQVRQAALRA